MQPKIRLSALILALSVFFSPAAQKPALADPLVVKDSHGNVASVDQGRSVMRPVTGRPNAVQPKDKQSAAAGLPAGVTHPDSEPDDLGIITDEPDGVVFEDEEGNIAVVEQDEEPAVLVQPAD